MSKKAFGVGLAAGAAWVLVSASAAVAGPAITTQWADTNLSQEECLERAERAIQDTRYSRIERVGQSRFGTRGDYTASIRCVTSKNIVFFMISGPSRDRTSGDMDTLYGNF